MSSDLLQVFVKLGNLHGTSNYVLYWNHGVASSDSVSRNWVQVLIKKKKKMNMSTGKKSYTIVVILVN